MQYILSLLLFTSVSFADIPPIQSLSLEKKIEVLEKELNEMRFQNHVTDRVYGEQKPAKLIPVDTPSLSLKEPEVIETDPHETPVETIDITESADRQTQENATEKEEGTDATSESVLSEEGELYEQGRHYLAQQRLDLAQQAFDDVVEKHDGTPESILARFWIGEFMLREKNYPGASLALGQAYGSLKKARQKKDFSKEAFHGEEDRLPEILAKLAYALKMINKRQDACITLRQMKKDYKKRPANLEWYVINLSKELKCR